MRTVLLLLTLAATAAELPAQERRAAVGAQVGYSRSDISGPDAAGIRGRQGALTGVFLYFPVWDGLAVRPELLFSLKGGRTLAELEGGGSATLDIELAYLELPLLAHYSPAVGSLRPVFFGGPAPSLQIGCDLAIIVQPEPLRFTCNEADIAFREWDAGLVVGAGAELHLNRAALALEGRYTAGLRSILSGADISNSTFALLLALTF